MERVLVTGAANIGRAGVATIVYKWGQQFDNNKIVYDYLMQRGLPEKEFQEAIKSKGGIIYTIKDSNLGLRNIVRWVENIISQKRYRVIHINTDTAYIAAAYIYAAKKAGIKKIYVHSHCTQIDDNSIIKRIIKTFLHKLCVPYVIRNADRYLACSKVAGEWMFRKKHVAGDKYKTIYNGIETELYLYNDKIRKKYRKDFDLDDKYVIGNIGRLSYQKNQEFLLKLFKKFHKYKSNSTLMLVGSGSLKEQLIQLAEQLNIKENIIFLENRRDIPALLSMMDIFVMPSRFEGLPVTMVEAQMASLPCVVSDTITSEAKFTKYVTFVHGWNEEKWIEAINKISKEKRIANSKLCDCVFDIRQATDELQKILIEGLE